MDTRKVTLVATIAVIALVAVGIGYAYTAITVNQGNQAEPEFITMTQAGDGAYTFTGNTTEIVYWDSANYKNSTGDVVNEFTLTPAVTTLVVDTGANEKKYTTVQIGKNITLNTTQDRGTIKAAGVDVKISTIGFNIPADENMLFFIEVTNSTTSEKTLFMVQNDVLKKYNDADQHHAWEAGDSYHIEDVDATTYDSCTVKVYYGYAYEDGKYIKTNDLDAKPLETPLNGAKIIFRTNTTDYNDGGTAVTAFTITGATAGQTVTIGEPLQLGVSFTDPNHTSVVVWYSSDNSKATVDSTGKVTGIAPTGDGTITITAQSTSGAITQTITLKIAAAS